MLVIKCEIWPDGNAERAMVLGVIAVKNVGKEGLAEDSDQFRYDVELQQFQTGTTKIAPRVRRARVAHWRRRGWLTLVRKAVEAVEHE